MMMTLAEAAALLGLSPSTLRTQVQGQRPKLRAVKYGKTWVVSEREVARYRAERLGRQTGGRPRKRGSGQG